MELTDGLVDQVKALVDAAPTLETLRDSMAVASSDLDEIAVGALLSQALMAAQLRGRSDGQDA